MWSRWAVSEYGGDGRRREEKSSRGPVIHCGASGAEGLRQILLPPEFPRRDRRAHRAYGRTEGLLLGADGQDFFASNS
jgi:hypothetical protein